MKPGFTNPLPLSVRTSDGWHCDLLEYLCYTDSNGDKYRTLTATDGGSTPWFLWWIVPPFGKRDWYAFILHDGCYRDCIQKWNVLKSTWHQWTPTEAQSNWLLDDALKSLGYGHFKRKCVDIALNWFGWRAFDADRRKKI